MTLHPFDDGNGRMARALADRTLNRGDLGKKAYSLSAQIRRDRKAYYEILETTQRGDMDVTPWMNWFLTSVQGALDHAEAEMGASLDQARFWDRARSHPLNERQLRVLRKLLDGFEGKITAEKWSKLGKCSPDTALRDINTLIEFGLLQRQPAGGRSTSYEFKTG